MTLEEKIDALLDEFLKKSQYDYYTHHFKRQRLIKEYDPQRVDITLLVRKSVKKVIRRPSHLSFG